MVDCEVHDRRSLRPLFDPRSVAVVGASDDPAKWGHHVALSALRGSRRRPIYLVNSRAGQVLGKEAFPHLRALPEAPELVVITVPAASFESVVEDALACGAQAIVGITAGLGERGGLDEERQGRLAARVRQTGAVLVGPNCAGLSDSSADLHLEWESYLPGDMGLVSQSGNLISEIAARGAAAGLGFSRYVSIGNQADLEAADFLYDFASHAPTKVVACYVEDFKLGRRFVDAARRCAASGKPVIVLTAGLTAAGGRTALSHTGALVTDLSVVRAACRAAGAHMARTPGELVDLAQLWSHTSRPTGRRVAVFGDGGGACAIAADMLVTAGLEVAPFGERLRRRIESELLVATDNPVDLAGAGERDLGVYDRVLGHLLESPEVDVVLLTGYFGGYSAFGDELRAREVLVARRLAERAGQSGKPFVTHSIFPDSPVATELRSGGVSVYERIEMASRAIASLSEADPSSRAGGETPAPAITSSGAAYFAARELVERAGIPLTRAREAASRNDALSAATEIGYPVALKALALLHKSDAGGIALGLQDEQQLGDAFDEMSGRFSSAGFSVEEMALTSNGLELIVGVKSDRRFGPVVMVGAGGIYAEIFRQIEVALAPARFEELQAILLRLPIAGLLTGARGRPPLDIDAAARAAASLSEFVAPRTEIAELEVNPLLVLPSGVVALDARVIMASGVTGEPPQ